MSPPVQNQPPLAPIAPRAVSAAQVEAAEAEAQTGQDMSDRNFVGKAFVYGLFYIKDMLFYSVVGNQQPTCLEVGLGTGAKNAPSN